MKLKELQKTEFWISTVLYVFAVLMLITSAGGRFYNENYYNFKGEHLSYSFFSNYLVPELFRYSILYFNFLFLNFYIVPSFLKKENIVLNSLLTLIILVGSGFTISICKTYTEAYTLVQYDDIQNAYNRLFFDGFTYELWVMVIVTAYVLLKEFINYFMANKHDKAYKNQMKIDAGFGIAFWFVGLMLWVASNAVIGIIVMWTLVIFASITVFIYSLYYLLPELYQKNRKFSVFFGQLILLSVLLAVPMSLVAFLLIRPRGEIIAITFAFHLPTQLLLTGPLAWFIYKRRIANSAELTSLKTELGKSDANLSFLKSQINPHFLFNALNTLYGTALQENAERTGEGIQKLGDMMRFMLHENVQDKISLTRDVDYLENYIALQKLRTSRSANIVIDTQIEEQLNNLQITPMLLIPFVENAFKHGISLQHPSHIRVTLQTKGSTLYFDVHNSIHIKADNDPEKLKSGIGLVNVKQRLALLYPKKHELIIRESAKEFFIHLTIEL
ncbi:histidine kinase [Pedobacter sp. KR3-3]|uniref:Histidine kinase n=1 Tax=Pedobacter albus TaxID=3113905 RepID=A0ABU7I8H1_9SPHI|nr:histidine kinase [Pedobacter sp. KR3-3]MEE1945767.1 histidine kinase [Pedobacter sp. KR3-3]